MKVSDFKLEKYLAGILSQEEMQELRSREETDDIFRARVKMMREENEKILEDHPFEALSAKMAELDANRGSDKANFGGAKLMPALVLRVAAVMVIALGIFCAVFVMNGESVVNGSARDSAGQDVAMVSVDDGTRIKGLSARMEIWKKSGETAVQMENLGSAQEGDELQLRYSVPEKCYGLLFSMDGNGVLTIHLGNGSGSIALEPGKMVTLPFAYKLDNAPRFEKFFLMTSKNTFALDGDNIDASLKQDGIKVVDFTVTKVSK